MLWLNDRSFAALGRITATRSPAPALGVDPAGCVAVEAVVSVAPGADVADGAAVTDGAAVAADGVDAASEPQEAATRPIAASVMIDRRSARFLNVFMITPSLLGVDARSLAFIAPSRTAERAPRAGPSCGGR